MRSIITSQSYKMNIKNTSQIKSQMRYFNECLNDAKDLCFARVFRFMYIELDRIVLARLFCLLMITYLCL